ncbi:MAG: LysR family transcriptional regulator [Roseovarius sp.]
MARAPSHQTIRRLTYFAAIAEAGSIRGAAERLGLSVPVVSTALSELEAELGVTLALRSTRSFTLTAAGEAVMEAARDTLAAAGRAMALAAGSGKAPLTGRLALTLPSEMAAHWLPPLLARFRAEAPDVALEIDANDGRVPLASSRFDMAIRVEGPLHGDIAGGTVLKTALVASTPFEPQRRAEGFTLDIPLIAPRYVGAVLSPRENDAPVALRFREIIETNSFVVARRMALAGLGAALLLEPSVRDDIAQGALLRLCPALEFGVVRASVVMRDALPSPAARRFAALVEAG